MRAVDDLGGASVFCSWSGGKDSALALHEAVVAGALPRLLVTMMIETGGRSRSHGLARGVLEAQAAAVGLPIRFGSATWADYEAELLGVVEEEAVGRGVDVGVFGDIDIEGHREWVQSVCSRAGATACLPLWRRDRERVMADLLGAGFRAVIVAVRDGVLPRELLGETLDLATLGAFKRAGVDLAGEQGEYHSLVVDGPIFSNPLEVSLGERSLRDGVWFVDVGVGDPPVDGAVSAPTDGALG